jgi:translation initiation factor 5A
METTKTAIKHLKPGKFCLIDGEPCRVKSITTSVSGKHGAAKARLDAVGIFDGRNRSIIKPADSEIEVPIVEKKSGQIVSIVGETAQVMDLETFETFESPIPEDLKDKIAQGCEVLYWILMDRKMIVQVKSD